ncbi:MAG: elongation factor Ts [Micrococcales bacterium]|nr:MAG: elongation factor Ts [Micrococcales bacterium]PIE27788.1 MAG: elongation factor Ts [Micrococcales bacterium]
MPNYTAADIKALRERSGAGMLDVKKALDDADGDADKAMEILRVKGLKGVTKREGRSASMGLVAGQVDGGIGTLVEVNCETDFVAKNDQFISLADKVLAAAVDSGVTETEKLLQVQVDGKTVADLVTDAAATMGEKIEVRRVGRLEGEDVSLYLHKTNPDVPPQIGVLLATSADSGSLGHDVALHVAAMNPTYLIRDEVPEETVAHERRIAEQTAREEGKPEQALPKIIEGRMNGFFKENVLMDQAFAKDPKKSIAQVAQEAGGQITGLVRFRVGA